MISFIFWYSYLTSTILILGKDIWFPIHQFCMSMTWLLTMVALVLIFVEKKTEPLSISSIKNNAHGIIGLIASVLTFIQPFMAYFRNFKRKIFNYSHLSVGMLAMILSISAVILITDLKSLKIDHDSTLYTAIAFAGFYVAMHIILSLVSLLSSQDENSLKNKLIVFLLVIGTLAGSGMAAVMIFYLIKGQNW